MSLFKDQLSEFDGNETFSRLEASLARAKVQPRPNSREMNDVARHAQAGDLDTNELDFNFSLDSSHYPLDDLWSIQDVFGAVQHEHHLANGNNFSNETAIHCLEVSGKGEGKASGVSWVFKNKLLTGAKEWHALDEQGLKAFVKSLFASLPDCASVDISSFVPLRPVQQTSFGSQILMTQSSVEHFFKILRLNPLFLLNMLGRPDYWAPQSHWESDQDGNLSACEFFCQHPRWNLQVQGAPLSVYMSYNETHDITTYVISHKQNDTSINALQKILNIGTETQPIERRPPIFLSDPFDFHIILSTLSFEASKYHVKRFQRFMWAQVGTRSLIGNTRHHVFLNRGLVQINKVDDHVAGLVTSDRAKLSDLTKQLHIISQNADSHLTNADVAIITAVGIRNAHSRFHSTIQSPRFVYQRATDSIEYIIASMSKQKIWFLNYKNRKDSTMNLVYNLVTQQDAANNINLAADMKNDSTSMNAIAALTMVFLPGTFTAVGCPDA
ncbi:MAG: hypothetical protein M1834_003694 [Cirrosporium novae-zelandiae]|nr:MAG: hypothetical protein M1834_003694 [Cirrosporium novae-zelandiae]